jgi:glutamyl-tRNA reductase
MFLLAVGLNHKTAPLEVREKTALTPEAVKGALRCLPRNILGGVILSTCNRCEVYGLGADSSLSPQELEALLGSQSGLERGDFSPYLYVYTQEEAMRHLFRVTAGVDSMVLGEDQIQGQVRQALELALEARSCPRPLSRLFRHALMVGKRARRETLISQQPVSVSHVAVLLARKLLGNLAPCTIIIISAGETGKLTGKIVKGCGAGQVIVTNRTHSRAQALARTLGGQAVPFSELPLALAASDIVISSTGAPGFILSPSMVAEAMAGRPQRPLLLIDIAVPRDIDPGVKEIPGVSLYNIDDLQAISQVGLEERQREVKRVEAIVEEEIVRAKRWWGAQEAVPTIIALREKAEAIRQKEIEKTLKALGLPPHGRERMDKLTKAILNKLLHPTITRLKRDPGLRQAAQELFGLEEKQT